MTDAYARLIAKLMPKHLPGDAEVVIINKPGGAGTIGLTSVSTAAADGYSLAFTTSSPIAIQPHYGKTPYTAESFAPVAKVFEVASSLNVHKDSDIKTYEEFLAYIKANPGKFTYSATGGTGSGTHIVSEQFANAVGAEMRFIPFEGTAQLTAALSGKQIEGSMSMPNLHRGGDARPVIFLTNAKPAHEAYENVPTANELGIDASTDFFGGILAPAGTPQDRIDIIAAALEATLKEQELIDLSNKFLVPLVFSGPAEFSSIVETVSAANKVEMTKLGLIE
ncbi:MAG: Bug family tripartite tricarboxylate transporter substrate binding protein [Pikeienuella sp.]